MASEKVAFITGGNKGIGLETARQLGKLGIKVVIGARDLAKGNEAIAKLKADGVTAETVKFDITKAADYKEVYKYLDQHFGKLDILVNNAGISKEDFLAGNKTSNTSAELANIHAVSPVSGTPIIGNPSTRRFLLRPCHRQAPLT